MGLPLYVICLFSFVVFSIPSLFCILSVLIIVCLGMKETVGSLKGLKDRQILSKHNKLEEGKDPN
jgi:hypothetical protein